MTQDGLYFGVGLFIFAMGLILIATVADGLYKWTRIVIAIMLMNETYKLWFTNKEANSK